MRLRGILPFRMLSRPVLAGLGLVVLISMFGVNGCMSYKLTGVYVEPSAGSCIVPGSTAQFTAYGTYTEGGHSTKTENITDEATWTTDLSEVATMSSSTPGLAIAGTTFTGLTNVKASAQGEFGLVWSSAPLSVGTNCVSNSGTPTTLSGIRILPGDQKLGSIGDTTKVVAVGLYSRSPFSRDLSEQATWTSSNPEVAKVSPGGLVTAVGAGEATITATQKTDQGAVVIDTIKVDVGSTSAIQ
jgi:uncharacterized protein YjdB